jgi:hypothetical protein
MRWKSHDAVLGSAIAWQEERGGRWVTVVLLTDRPVPRESIGPGQSIDDAVSAAKAQGIAFAITSGGMPLKDDGVRVFYRDGAEIGSTTLTGEGGFEITSQSATQIKGRAVLGAFGVKASKTENAWSVSFDAPVLQGNAKRMDAEGVPLGTDGGQPGKDLQAALQAMRALDYATLATYAAPELATLLRDPATRSKNLKQLQQMTPPESRIIGGLRKGDTAEVYWVQIWPDALDNRCVEDLVLEAGRWRSVATACTPE